MEREVCKYSLCELTDFAKKFEAGQVANHLHGWENLTSDTEILRTVAGDIINFENSPPERASARNCNVSSDTRELMDQEIQSMIDKKIIVPSHHESGEFLSPIFPVAKPDGSIRIILNLKELQRLAHRMRVAHRMQVWHKSGINCSILPHRQIRCMQICLPTTQAPY